MKKAQRPVDVKDMPWSYIGKDALDAAAERAWEAIRHDPERDTWVQDGYTDPYHLLPSGTQELVQRAVLDVLGNAVPAMLRQRAKEVKKNGASTEYADALFDLADELEADHG